MTDGMWSVIPRVTDLPSSVGGVIDANGYLCRVVVTERERMHLHVVPGERLIVVPGLKIREPVSWREIPEVIQKVEAHIKARHEGDR